jgi:hypothetical protein
MENSDIKYFGGFLKKFFKGRVSGKIVNEV